MTASPMAGLLAGAALLASGAVCACAKAPPRAVTNSSMLDPAAPAATPPPAKNVISSRSDSSQADGNPATIDFAGIGAVTVRPLRLPGDKYAKCLVELSSAGTGTQRLTVIGEGDTETLDCGKVTAFGRVPSPAGTARIALLYRAYSPNTRILQPVILSRAGAGSAWTIDDALAQTIGEQAGLQTIPAIRAWLGRTRR